MSRVILVTGTDTGVGKTFVSQVILRSLSERGVHALGVKPVETGCDDVDIQKEDGVQLAAATGQAQPLRALQRFSLPMAPPAAADAEGRALSFDRWVSQIEALSADCEVMLVEGAGGLLAPLTWKKTALDLARALSAEVLLVGADKLGTLNHVRLTIEALGDVPLLGVVLSAPQVPDETTGHNEASLRKSGVPHKMLTLGRAPLSGEDTTRLLGLIARTSKK